MSHYKDDLSIGLELTLLEVRCNLLEMREELEHVSKQVELLRPPEHTVQLPEEYLECCSNQRRLLSNIRKEQVRLYDIVNSVSRESPLTVSKNKHRVRFSEATFTIGD